jgi:hypothetical protein
MATGLAAVTGSATLSLVVERLKPGAPTSRWPWRASAGLFAASCVCAVSFEQAQRNVDERSTIERMDAVRVIIGGSWEEPGSECMTYTVTSPDRVVVVSAGFPDELHVVLFADSVILSDPSGRTARRKYTRAGPNELLVADEAGNALRKTPCRPS